MEEFGWIILFFLFWVFSSIGDFRKQQRKKRRRDAEGETGPQAAERGLASDLEEGARRAEEALRRWEARQRAGERDESGPAPDVELRRQLPDRRDFGIAGSSMSRERERARRELRAKRREAAELQRRAEAARSDAEAQREDAYEAIAGMLAGREVGAGTEIGSGTQAGAERQGASLRTRGTGRHRARATEAGSGMPLARSAPMGRSGVTPARSRGPATAASGRLGRLTALQQAVVWGEVLAPPVALRPSSHSGLTRPGARP